MNLATKFIEKMNASFGDKHPISIVLFGYGVVLLLCVPVLYLMDFADMVPLALLMGIIALFFAFFPFRKNETRLEESVEQFTKSSNAWRKKRVLLITVAVVAGLFIWGVYENRAQSELNCLKKVEYRRNGSLGYYGIFEGSSLRKFKTQDEAMEYCMKVLSADF